MCRNVLPANVTHHRGCVNIEMQEACRHQAWGGGNQFRSWQIGRDALPEGCEINGTIPSDQSDEATGKGRNLQEGSFGTEHSGNRT
jgi:hypothetical protein